MVLRNFFFLLSLSRLSGILWDLTRGVFRLCFRGVRSSRVLMGWGVDIWNRSHIVIKHQLSNEFTFNPNYTYINKPNSPNSTMYYKLNEIEWIWVLLHNSKCVYIISFVQKTLKSSFCSNFYRNLEACHRYCVILHGLMWEYSIELWGISQAPHSQLYFNTFIIDRWEQSSTDRVVDNYQTGV